MSASYGRPTDPDEFLYIRDDDEFDEEEEEEEEEDSRRSLPEFPVEFP